MPWKAAFGNTYRLCLLDTNVLSEILKNPTVEGRGFIKYYKPSSYVPCLTIYNIIELRRKPKLFEAYCDLFSLYSHFLLKPYQLIFQNERLARGEINPDMILMNAFSPLGANHSYNVAMFFTQIFDDPSIAELERTWRIEERKVLQSWLATRRNFSPSKSDANARDAERYIKEAGLQTIIGLNPEWAKNEIDSGRIPNIDMFPSMKVMLYSQYYRIHNPHWEPRSQEVTDVNIMAASPYVDVVITENFQAEILRRIKYKVAGMQNLEIATLRNLRRKK